MVRAEDACLVEQERFRASESVCSSPGHPEKAGNVAASGERVRMVGAKDACLVAQRFVEVKRLRCAAGCSGPIGEVAAGDEGVDVVNAGDTRKVRHERFVEVERVRVLPGLPGPVGKVAAGDQSLI